MTLGWITTASNLLKVRHIFCFLFPFLIWLFFKATRLKYEKQTNKKCLWKWLWLICISKSFGGKEYTCYILSGGIYLSLFFTFFQPHLGFNFLVWNQWDCFSVADITQMTCQILTVWLTCHNVERSKTFSLEKVEEKVFTVRISSRKSGAALWKSDELSVYKTG